MFKQLVIACLWAVLPCAASASGLPSYPFIHASGSGSVTVMPDLGQIDFEITARDADPALAVQLVETRAAEIRVLLEQQGVALDAAEFRDLRKDMRTTDSGVVYEVRCAVRLTLRELAKWPLVVAPLLDKPNLDGFMTVFDTTDRARIEIELMQDAVKSARRKAEGMAAAFGRKLGAVNAVSSGELKNLTRAMNLAPSDYGRNEGGKQAETGRAELLAITALKLAQPVDVIFRIR
jgi:uncharacterized protein